VAIFYDARGSASDAFATFYGDKEVYAAKFRLQAGRRPLEIVFSSPDTRPLHGAAFTFGDDASACVVKTPARVVDPSTERSDANVERFEVATPVILTKAGTSGPPARCAASFTAAEIKDRAVEPTYPDVAREQGATGLAFILVRVAPDGSSIGADVMRSSGNAALDGSAMGAARATKYRGAIFDCEPVPDSFIFRAEFDAYGSQGGPVVTP
jgi:TonB family protein